MGDLFYYLLFILMNASISGRNICHGKSKWNAVHVVSNRVHFSLSAFGEIRGCLKKVPWSRKGKLIEFWLYFSLVRRWKKQVFFYMVTSTSFIYFGNFTVKNSFKHSEVVNKWLLLFDPQMVVISTCLHVFVWRNK